MSGVQWHNWEALERELTSDPHAVCWGDRINVFVKGTDNGLWYRMWDGVQWHNWEALEGELTSEYIICSIYYYIYYL
jgi:hypothetical protein